MSGKICIVTGANCGIGKETALGLAQMGARVIMVCRNAEKGKAALEEICREFGSSQVDLLIADMSSQASVRALAEQIQREYPRLDVLVNNAGGSPYALAAEATHNFHRKIVELNVLAPLLVSQHANALMQKQPNGGSIVNICSVSGRRPTPGTAAYGVAKAGFENLTLTLAVEWAPKVRVNAVVVGMVETERSELFYGDAESIARVAATVPLGRLAKPADIGWAAAFLTSAVASYISGATLEVHGGGEPPPYLAASSANK